MKILVAGWDSGGGVEAVQTVVQRAVARGHDVRVLGTEGLRGRFESAGAVFRRYRYAPDNDLRRPETDLVKDWQARNPLSLWVRVRDRLLIGPAREFCRDVLEELRRDAADVVVVPGEAAHHGQAGEERDGGEHDLVAIIEAQQAGAAEAVHGSQVPADLRLIVTLVIVRGGLGRPSAPHPCDHCEPDPATMHDTVTGPVVLPPAAPVGWPPWQPPGFL